MSEDQDRSMEMSSALKAKSEEIASLRAELHIARSLLKPTEQQRDELKEALIKRNAELGVLRDAVETALKFGSSHGFEGDIQTEAGEALGKLLPDAIAYCDGKHTEKRIQEPPKDEPRFWNCCGKLVVPGDSAHPYGCQKPFKRRERGDDVSDDAMRG